VGVADVPQQAPRPRLPTALTFHRDRFTADPATEREIRHRHDAEITESGYYVGRRIAGSEVGLDPDPVPDADYGWTEHVARKQSRLWWDEATPKLRDDLLALGFRGFEP
jgi:hypothetical protein